jgi:hypothetical protein
MRGRHGLESWYPEKLAVGPQGNTNTLEFMQRTFAPGQHFHYSEYGIYHGNTALGVCQMFPNAVLHLFDYEENAEIARRTLAGVSNKVYFYTNTQKYNDSYNWSLIRLIEAQRGVPLFDYSFLDGAHTFAVDALNFFLCDKLTKVGGFIDFDDYHWTLRRSSLDPKKVPSIADQYTDEQIDTKQVKMIVDNLVRPDPRFQELVEEKIFRKIG